MSVTLKPSARREISRRQRIEVHQPGGPFGPLPFYTPRQALQAMLAAVDLVGGVEQMRENMRRMIADDLFWTMLRTLRTSECAVNEMWKAVETQALGMFKHLDGPDPSPRRAQARRPPTPALSPAAAENRRNRPAHKRPK